MVSIAELNFVELCVENRAEAIVMYLIENAKLHYPPGSSL